MSDDLIERLRAMDATSQPNLLTVRESADRIEALKADIGRYRKGVVRCGRACEAQAVEIARLRAVNSALQKEVSHLKQDALHGIRNSP